MSGDVLFAQPPPPLTQNPSMTLDQGGSQQFQALQFKPFKPQDGEFDGKRLRKNVMRKTVDYNCSIVNYLENRVWQRDDRDRHALQPDICFASELMPPAAYPTNPINAVVSKFVRTATNKAKCPIFCLAWTPEGRRLVTGASSGEFTLWNGLTFNFETILQAHDSSVRAMVWSHNDQWMITGDTTGYVKYWQTNMNNVKLFQAHKDPVRGLSFSPMDMKFASGSDDGTVRIWDFYRCYEERVLRGHGADVKCLDWHPSKSLLASGSKDNQQPIKLWDPRTGQGLTKIHAHKSTVMDLKWNPNGKWLCSASRDHLLKLFDIRNLSVELQVFRGHKKEASSISWHPQHEGLFASGGSDGSILFWHVGNDKEVGNIDTAHDGIVWDLAWHPLGHILCSGSNDHTSKFWTRNRMGDKMRDKYNLNTLPPGILIDDSMDIDDIPVTVDMSQTGSIPGMGPEDRVEEVDSSGQEIIPGLEFDPSGFDRFRFLKKMPYAKPIPKTFQAAWNAAGTLEEFVEEPNPLTCWVVVESATLFHPIETEETFFGEDGEEYPEGTVTLDKITADAIAYYGFYIPLEKVPATAVKKAFSTLDEEKAIEEVTKDPDFARKLIKEKNQLVSPSGFRDVDAPPPTVGPPTPPPGNQEANNPNDGRGMPYGNAANFNRGRGNFGPSSSMGGRPPNFQNQFSMGRNDGFPHDSPQFMGQKVMGGGGNPPVGGGYSSNFRDGPPQWGNYNDQSGRIGQDMSRFGGRGPGDVQGNWGPQGGGRSGDGSSRGGSGPKFQGNFSNGRNEFSDGRNRTWNSGRQAADNFRGPDNNRGHGQGQGFGGSNNFKQGFNRHDDNNWPGGRSGGGNFGNRNTPRDFSDNRNRNVWGEGGGPNRDFYDNSDNQSRNKMFGGEFSDRPQWDDDSFSNNRMDSGGKNRWRPNSDSVKSEGNFVRGGPRGGRNRGSSSSNSQSFRRLPPNRGGTGGGSFRGRGQGGWGNT